ncbi:MAG: four helix bundle protein [Candidatus Marinimicrobia bacterium]|jgi:four helix bundle protein|nr:four helix bundle protein [Candidatus Neomarinimicrobiota bacterium]
METNNFKFSFEKLDVWKLTRVFQKDIYKITKSFPKDEIKGLREQIRRAAISVSSNIAEGSAKFSRKDFARYIQISFGSLMEVLNQLYAALDLLYIDEKQFYYLKKQIHQISIKLSALRRSILNNQ